MSIIWVFLASPDLGITEAAVGAGISNILFFAVLKRIRVMEEGHTLDLLEIIMKNIGKSEE